MKIKKEKIIYALTVEDVLNVSKEKKLPFNAGDLLFIEEEIGNYIGDKWQDAIEYALTEVNKK